MVFNKDEWKTFNIKKTTWKKLVKLKIEWDDIRSFDAVINRLLDEYFRLKKLN
jgi:predicted CopG family antitoxin